jgi:hypothetical protein
MMATMENSVALKLRNLISAPRFLPEIKVGRRLIGSRRAAE